MPQADTWGAFLVCLFHQQGKGKFGGRKRCGNCRSCGKTKERFSHSSLNLRFTVPTTPTAAGPSSNTTFLLLPPHGPHVRFRGVTQRCSTYESFEQRHEIVGGE